KCDEARQGVLLKMCFQMGIGSAAHGTGLLGFKNTLAMIERGDYESAAQGMMNSVWAKQTPNRAKRLAEQMRTGEWQWQSYTAGLPLPLLLLWVYFGRIKAAKTKPAKSLQKRLRRAAMQSIKLTRTWLRWLTM